MVHEWKFLFINVIDGPAALSIWIWKVLVTIDRHARTVNLAWNPL